MKVVINRCFGGFGLSARAFERLIALGIPRVPHIAQARDPKTGLYKPEPRNEGEVIIDYSHPEATWDGIIPKESHLALCGRYSASWLDRQRAHPLLVQVVEELGPERETGASGMCAKLAVVEIQDGVEWEIGEYDGLERVDEQHRSWT